MIYDSMVGKSRIALQVSGIPTFLPLGNGQIAGPQKQI
jgi:hypothetical protein